MQVVNLYVNRNMIDSVVGSQPFGGGPAPRRADRIIRRVSPRKRW